MPNLSVVQHGHGELAQQLQAVIERLDAMQVSINATQVSINALQVSINALQVSINAMQASINAMEESINSINMSLQRLPMQLANATASMIAPILFPRNGHPPPPGFPTTKLALVRINTVDAQVAAQYLGLPPLPHGTTVELRRQHIVNFLGSVYS
ncbi:hypothetical protein H4582DRAFT_2072982 [Lactarius indigo]|nr:hypothetical protein H4582DRAFT_2072982 [Lactarius indigo]